MPTSKDSDRQEGLEFHQRMLAEDDTATLDIAESYQPRLENSLAQKWSQTDQHDIGEAVLEALYNYFTHPQRYNPAKATLFDYLLMSAKGDLKNNLKKQNRQPKLVPFVGKSPQGAEYELDVADDTDIEAAVIEENSPVWLRIAEILPDHQDQQMARWILNDISQVQPYAELLKITDQPIEQQRLVVNRHKERIRKKLKRNLNLAELREND